MSTTQSGRKRVVITGIGPVTPIGTGVEEYWQALLAGRNGIGPITRYDAAPFVTRIAAEIKDFPAEKYVSRKEVRRMDRFCLFAMAASVLAVEDAGIAPETYRPEDVGVLIGSGIGGIETIEAQYQALTAKGPGRVSPFLIPMIIVNMASGLVSMRFNYKGPNTAVATACATGSHAIGDAFRIIQRGEALAMLAGGAEACITPLAMAGFCSLGAMSTRNDSPETASRPFDADRDGFVMGEGAGVVMLEEYEAAKRRGAKIYAEVVGYGMSGDAHHMTAPDPDGAGIARAMECAMAESGRPIEDFTYINAHGTSTQLNDKFETMGIKRAFGERAKKIMVSSTKSMTGHLIGAAGGIEAIACALAVSRGAVPPTMNYQTPDPECDLDYVPNQARQVKVEAALNSNLGFGGHNAVLALAAV